MYLWSRKKEPKVIFDEENDLNQSKQSASNASAPSSKSPANCAVLFDEDPSIPDEISSEAINKVSTPTIEEDWNEEISQTSFADVNKDWVEGISSVETDTGLEEVSEAEVVALFQVPDVIVTAKTNLQNKGIFKKVASFDSLSINLINDKPLAFEYQLDMAVESSEENFAPVAKKIYEFTNDEISLIFAEVAALINVEKSDKQHEIKSEVARYLIQELRDSSITLDKRLALLEFYAKDNLFDNRNHATAQKIMRFGLRNLWGAESAEQWYAVSKQLLLEEIKKVQLAINTQSLSTSDPLPGPSHKLRQ